MPQQIIACIDGSSATTAVCDCAAWAGERLAMPVTLLHTLARPSQGGAGDLSGSLGPDSREQLLAELAALDAKRARLDLEQGRLLLNAARQRLEYQGLKQVQICQRHGSLVETLAEQEASARLVVLGRQGSESQHQLAAIGSQLESVIRTLHRPILVTQSGFQAPRRALLAYDGSPTASKALQMVAASPLLRGVECHLVMIGDDERPLREAGALLTQAGFQVTTALLGGEVESALIRYVEDHQMELLVMGAYGHSRIRQFLVGSHTTQMLHKSRIPMLLLR